MYNQFIKIILLLLLPIIGFSQPAGFVDEVFVGGFNQAVGLTFDDNGKMYVYEKRGIVWVVENGVKNPTPLIDISDEVGGWRDFGLLGFTLDPNFLNNGYFYLLYIVDRHHLQFFGTNNYNPNTNDYFKATIGRITRYQANANLETTNYNSRTVLLGATASDGFPNLHQSHGTGSLVFGTDGTLMASFGDGASYTSVDQGSASETYYQQAIQDGIISSAENIGAYRSQLLTNYAGKLLRIDPSTGLGLPSNPYYQSGNPGSVRSKVWSRGLRNPCRFTKRSDTGSHDPDEGDPGTFFIGDVGWGNREELNVVAEPALNFGWPKYEGMTHEPGYNNSTYAPSTHTRAKLDWRNGTARAYVNGSIVNIGSSQVPGPNFTGNCSIGGTWYHGHDYPDEYHDTYFHADFGGDWIMNFGFDQNNNPTFSKAFKSAANNIVFVGTSPVDGGIYYIAGAQGNSNDITLSVRKISYVGGSFPPIANISSNTTFGPSPLTVEFNGGQSYDPDGTALTYSWNFGDGTTSNGINPSHTFPASNSIQSYTVTLTVTDGEGLSDQASVQISLNNTPPNIISTSVDNINTFNHNNGTTLNLSAVVNDAEHSNASLSYQWITELHHNDHFHQEAAVTSSNASSQLSPIGCDGATYWYRIKLIVTDPSGLFSIYQKDIFPDCSGSNQSISFNNIPDKLNTDSDFNITATASSGLAVTFHILEGPATVSGNTISLTGEPGTVTVRAIQSGSGQYAPALPVERSFDVFYPIGNCPNIGSISREVWTNLNSSQIIADVPLNTTPDIEDEINIFEVPVNALDQYGTRIRGYLCPAISGNYRFWISSDDNGELYLSSDNNPANKTLIASVPIWSASREWNKFPEQQSALINLTAGERYYVEALMKEGAGGDNLAVGWQNPAGEFQRPIPGFHLIPWDGGLQDQTISFPSIPNKFTTDNPFNLAASASSGLPVTYSIISGPATVSGNTISLTGGTGTVTVQANQAGNNQYNPASSVNRSFTVSTAPPTCNNVTNGGTIGGNQTECGSYDPTNMANLTAPSGGSGALSYRWQRSTTSASGPWTNINSNTANYNPTTITTTTWYRRLSRRANCTPYAGISNVIEKTVDVCGGNDTDLELTMTATSSIYQIWQNNTFTVTINNTSNVTSNDVKVYFPLPTGFAYISQNESAGNFISWLGEWNIGTLAAGASETLEVVLFAIQDSNTATAFAQVSTAIPTDSDSTPNNNSGSTPNEDDEASVFINIPGGGNPNLIDQTISFPSIPNKLNTDPSFNLNATASSGLPISYAILSGPATISGNTITLTGGTGAVTVQASQGGNTVYNPAPNVNRSFSVNGSGGNNDIDLDMSITSSSANLSIWQNITIDVVVNNTGTSTASNVKAVIDVPSGFAFVNASTSNGGFVGWTGIWDIGTIPAGGTANLALTLFVTQDASQKTIFTQITSASPNDSDSSPDNNSGTSPNEDDEAAVIIYTPGGGNPNLLDQTISFSNIPNKVNTDPAFNISATASSGLPVSFSVVSGPAVVSGNTITLTGATGTVTIQANQAGNTTTYNPAPSVNKSFVVSGSGNGNDDIDLELSITSSSNELQIWQNLNFTVTLVNNGGIPASNLVVALPVPPGFAYVTENPSVGTYVAWAGEWNVGILAAGATATLDLTLFVVQNTNPSTVFTQVKTASPTDSDSTPGNNSGTTPNEDDEAAIIVNVPGSNFSITCNNITNGGSINGNESICGNYDPANMGNAAFPSGGNGATVEYKWQASNNSANGPWTDILNSDNTSYDPASINQSTWYRRLSRRLSCDDYSGISNVILKEVQTGCGNPTYCASSGNNTTSEAINRVQLGSIDNTTGSDGGYGDYTNMTTTLTAGTSNAILLEPYFSNTAYNEFWVVWIDLNKDGDFDDAGEAVFSGNGTSTITGNFTLPNSITDGATRMRVSMQYNTAPFACGSFNYGEVEDYTVNLVSNLQIGINSNNPTEQWITYSLFPNPVNDDLNINFETNVEDLLEWKIINTNSVEMLSGDFAVYNKKGTQNIDVKALKNGYFIFVLKSKNGTITSRKFIKY